MGENTRDMKSFASCVVFAICLGAVAAEVYFEEDFSGDWESRWVQSENKDDLGKFVATAGINGDASNLGLKTSQDAKFYGISAVTKEFSNKDKPLVVQYSVKHEQGIDCGGAYLKLGPAPFDGKKFHGETVYNVMFGPDICGMTKRTLLMVGSSSSPRRSTTPRTRNPRTGSMRLRWMTLRTRSQRDTMTSKPRSLTPRPPGPMTGMTSPM